MKSYDVEARKARNAPPLHLMGCWRVYYAIWGLTYFAAAVFHLVHLLVKYCASFTSYSHALSDQMDSPTMEKADYFGIALAIIYHTSIGLL